MMCRAFGGPFDGQDVLACGNGPSVQLATMQDTHLYERSGDVLLYVGIAGRPYSPGPPGWPPDQPDQPDGVEPWGLG